MKKDIKNLIIFICILINVNAGYSQINFTKHVIDNSIGSPFHLYVVDFNHNGKKDILVGTQGGKIVLYMNNGTGSFTKRTVESHYPYVWNVFAIDLDRDGDMDVLAAVSGVNTIAWWENKGGGFTRHIVGTDIVGAEAVRAGDLDNDGDIDVVGAACIGDKAYWFRNDGNQNFTKILLGSNINTPYYMNVCDVDKDGDNDIFLGASYTYWWRNDGSGNFTRHYFDKGFKSCYSFELTNYNNDKYTDFILASYRLNEIAIYTNRGGSFSKISVTKNFSQTHSAQAGDLDGDGDVDVAANSRDKNEVAWFENVGNRFIKHTIASNFQEAHGIAIADFDRDGDLDIVATARTGHQVAWWENRSSPGESITKPDTPSGPASGLVGESLTYTTGGATSSLGHTVEYQFDWGDGNYSSWGAATATHAYSNGGTFTIKARARCSSHTSRVSGWSVGYDVAITEETVSQPNRPAGPDSAVAGDMLNFSVSGSSSSLGHAIEYQFNWGDGSFSSWGDSNRTHQFASPGTFSVKARARCKTHTSAVSGWSAAKSVIISPKKFQISGTVQYYSNRMPIPNIAIAVSGDLNQQLSVDSLGNYSLIVDQNMSIDLRPNKQKAQDVSHLTITMYDAALTAQSVLGLINLSAAQQVAADADKNGAILSYDAALIAQYAVGITDIGTSHVAEWSFLPEQISLSNIQSNKTGKNFSGIVVGDVSGDWTSSKRLKKIARNSLYDIDLENKNRSIIVKIKLKEPMNVASIDFDLSYGDREVTFLQVKRSNQLNSFSLYENCENGRLRLGFLNPDNKTVEGEIFELHFRMNGKNAMESFSINKFQVNDIQLAAQTELFLDDTEKIQSYELEQNYPNPFNSVTQIRYKLPEDGIVSIAIYNIDGQIIKRLVNRFQSKGSYSVQWDGTDDFGNELAGGIYVYRIKVNNFEQSKKLLMIK